MVAQNGVRRENLRKARGSGVVKGSSLFGKENIRKYFDLFCAHVGSMYGALLLNRRTTSKELKDFSRRYGDSGFPGCIMEVDYTKIRWKKFPIVHQGQHKNMKYEYLQTMGVKAWCDRAIYCWSWFAGRCGTKKDLKLM